MCRVPGTQQDPPLNTRQETALSSPPTANKVILITQCQKSGSGSGFLFLNYVGSGSGSFLSYQRLKKIQKTECSDALLRDPSTYYTSVKVFLYPVFQSYAIVFHYKCPWIKPFDVVKYCGSYITVFCKYLRECLISFLDPWTQKSSLMSADKN